MSTKTEESPAFECDLVEILLAPCEDRATLLGVELPSYLSKHEMHLYVRPPLGPLPKSEAGGLSLQE